MAESAPPAVRDLGRDAYERFKSAIRAGALPPGTRITEADLAGRFGVSRTPVRQAITRLETEGLLRHEPRRGLVVTRLAHQEVVELYAMREVLESTAARFAAQHASESELATLAGLVEAEPALFGDPARLSELNERLHGLLYLAAHNRFLLRSLEQLSVTMALLPTMLTDPARAREGHEEHVAILAALQARDGDAAEAAVRAHIRSAQRHRIAGRLLQADP
jgi:DNA-binding GntR family transcriptional regulator